MDSDFQQRYQDAEQAFAEARYDDARGIASTLLKELAAAPEDADTQAAVLGWRAFVALLLGNIELYGLGRPQSAKEHFQLVLDSQPHDTLAELAQQGLTLASRPVADNKGPEPEQQPQEVVPARAAEDQPTIPSRTRPLPDLLKDPFLQQDATDIPAASTPARSTAMPWLDEGPELISEAEPSSEPEPPSQPDPTPSSTSEPETTPAPTPQPEPSPEPEPTAPAEPDAMEVLKDYLLRVKLNAGNSDDMPKDINGDEHKGSSPSITQQLRDLWKRLNGR